MSRKWNEQKNLETKNKIMEASLELILEKGFSKFTLSEAALKLNVTKATIYWYFSSKDDLMRSIADRIWASQVDFAKNFDQTHRNATEKLLKLLLQKDSLHLCVLPIKFLLEWDSENNDRKEKIYKGYSQYQNSLANILREGRENGEFHFAISEQEMASFIISVFDGIAVNHFSLKEHYTALSESSLTALLKSILGF